MTLWLADRLCTVGFWCERLGRWLGYKSDALARVAYKRGRR